METRQVIHCQPRPLVSVVSLAEVRVLAEVNHWGERKRQALERTLQSLVVVDIHHPLVIDALQMGKLSVGPPYFNLVFAPLMVPLLFVLVPGTVAHWREARMNDMVLRLRWVGAAALALAAAAIVVWLLMLNTSSELVHKLGGPYFKYLPDCPQLGYRLPKNLGGATCTADAFMPRTGMLHTMYWFRFGHTVGALAFACIAFALVRYPTWGFARSLAHRRSTA